MNNMLIYLYAFGTIEITAPPSNLHGVTHKRNLLQTVMAPIPDLRSGLDDPTTSDPTAFQGKENFPNFSVFCFHYYS